MIYQLVTYLRSEFPTELFYVNDRVRLTAQEEVPDRNVLVKETPGTIQPWTKYTSQVVQIITRDIDDPKSRQLSYLILESINDKFGLILPAITVDGEVFPELITAQISANGSPYPLGADPGGLYEWLTNYRVIYERV